MEHPNKKKNRGCLPVFLLLAAAVIVLWKGWGRLPLSHLKAAVTDAPPSYTLSSEAEPLKPASGEHTPLRYYRSLLSPADQALYDTLSDAIGGFAPSVSGIREVDAEHLFTLLGYVSFDHPEYFWFNGAANAETTTMGGLSLVDLTFTYTMTPTQAADTHREIDAVTADYLSHMAGLSEVEKVEYVYHRLGVDTLYDLAYPDQSFVTVLLQKTGLCAGYARSMQYILSLAGMDILYLSGSSVDGDPHSWNVVKIGEHWYHTDATWGDPLPQTVGDESNLTWAYLFQTTDEALLSHVMDSPELIPPCTDPGLGYYHRAGLVYDGVGDALQSALTDAVRSGVPFCFQAADAGAFSAILANLESENGILSEVGQTVGREQNQSRYGYFYRNDPLTLTFRVEYTFTA